MIQLDEDALICDLAETYHIHDYKQLPPLTVAVFSIGLRENARIKMKYSGNEMTLDTILLALISDRASELAWMKTRDGQKGVNRPVSILGKLLNAKDSKEVESFTDGEDFIAQRNRLVQQIEGGGEEEWLPN